MKRESRLEELPGYAVVEMDIGGWVIIRDNSDWYSYMNEHGRAIKIKRLPGMKVKWGFADEW